MPGAVAERGIGVLGQGVHGRFEHHDAELRVDGGATANDFLCQFQADVLGLPILRPRVRETTGLGAAYLAGLGIGLWPGPEALRSLWRLDRAFEPTMPAERREALYAGWRRAVARARDWAREDP